MTKFNDSHFNILIVCHFPECGSIFFWKKTQNYLDIISEVEWKLAPKLVIITGEGNAVIRSLSEIWKKITFYFSEKIDFCDFKRILLFQHVTSSYERNNASSWPHEQNNFINEFIVYCSWNT